MNHAIIYKNPLNRQSGQRDIMNTTIDPTILNRMNIGKNNQNSNEVLQMYEVYPNTSHKKLRK